MKIVFFGTPDYVLPVLKKLHKYHEIVAVVTQPPKPTGRKQILSFSPVDKWAHGRKIPIFYKSLELIDDGVKADLGILAAYGEIIPKSVIDLFPHGILVIHPSLLPKYRGASPVQAAIAAGEEKTGVTVIKMDEKLDHGPIISQFEEEINPDDTTKTLRERLFVRSAQVLLELLPAYLAGKIKPREQDHKQATFTKVISKQDGYLDLKKTKPHEAERFIRAMDPWPGAWTLVNEKRLKILKAHLDPDTGHLILDTVQLEGKNPVSWEEFTRGYPFSVF